MHSKEAALKKLFFVCQNTQNTQKRVEATDLILLEELHFNVRGSLDGHFCDPG